MKRLMRPAVVLAFVVLGCFQIGNAATAASCPPHPLTVAERHAHVMFSGSGAITKAQWRTQMVLLACQRLRAYRHRVRALDHRLHVAHAARVAAARLDAEFASSEDDYVPGVPVWFASCVAWYESTDGALSSNRYGILGGGGTGSLEQQKHAFAAMYASASGPYGHETPWAAYDKCGVTRFSGP